MGLLQKLLSSVGLGNSSSDRERTSGETTVTVEHEPDTTSESAVKGTEGVSEGTSASGSTGTITDTDDDEVGAAEPSEAAGTAAGDVDEEPERDAAESDLDTADEDDETAEEAETATDADAVEEAETTTDADAVEEAEPDAETEATGSDESPDVLNGIGPAYAERLADAGVDTVADLADADAAALADETGLGEGRIANWIEQANDY